MHVTAVNCGEIVWKLCDRHVKSMEHRTKLHNELRTIMNTTIFRHRKVGSVVRTGNVNRLASLPTLSYLNPKPPSFICWI